MDILAVQQRVIDAGYQFSEYIFNDGKERNCHVTLRRVMMPSLFMDRSRLPNDLAWGRFTRMDAWKHIAEYLDELEFKDSIPENVE